MMMFEGERWVGTGHQEESGASLTMIGGGGIWKLVSAAQESKSGGTKEEVQVRLSWLRIVADYLLIFSVPISHLIVCSIS